MKKTETSALLQTGDRDSLQLVSDKTSVHLCSNKQDILYTPEKILETYGVTPKELIEIKAIQGDTSDKYSRSCGNRTKGCRRPHSEISHG